MKLPASKRRQIEKKGRTLPAKTEGGGARERQQQFEKQRGVKRGAVAPTLVPHRRRINADEQRP